MHRLNKQQRAAVLASASTSSVLLASRPSPVLAQTASDPVAQMTSGVNSLAGIAAVAAPIAIGVTIFAVAALLVKRFLYS